MGLSLEEGIEHRTLITISILDRKHGCTSAVTGRLLHRTVIDLADDMPHLRHFLLSGMLRTRNQFSFLRQNEIVRGGIDMTVIERVAQLFC